jgi:hypothetical protein
MNPDDVISLVYATVATVLNVAILTIAALRGFGLGFGLGSLGQPTVTDLASQ